MRSIYLKEATLDELLAEISQRFDNRAPIAEWAAPVVFAITSYYGISPEDLKGLRRDDHLAKLRHLTIAMLARMNPGRTRAEVCAILGRGHEMYEHAKMRTDERILRFPDFRNEVNEVMKVIREAIADRDAHGHCRSARQVTRGPVEQPAQSP